MIQNIAGRMINTTHNTNKTAAVRENQALDESWNTILEKVKIVIRNKLNTSVTKAEDWANLPNSEFRILGSLKTVQMVGKGVTENKPEITPSFVAWPMCRYFDEWKCTKAIYAT